MALRLRWQWLSRMDSSRAWSGMEIQSSAPERDLFFASTTMLVGDGNTTKFWDDQWTNGRALREIAPQLYACIPKRCRKQRTVEDGLHAHSWACDIQASSAPTKLDSTRCFGAPFFSKNAKALRFDTFLEKESFVQNIYRLRGADTPYNSTH